MTRRTCAWAVAATVASSAVRGGVRVIAVGRSTVPGNRLDGDAFDRRQDDRAMAHLARRALPDHRLLNQRYGKRFDPQDMDQVRPVPSGLLGRVRLITVPAPIR